MQVTSEKIQSNLLLSQPKINFEYKQKMSKTAGRQGSY